MSIPRGQAWSRRGVERDAHNHKLGRLGEKFVVEFEKRRLAELGRDDLVGKVEWVADTRGDGLGFDVLSFDEHDDSELFVEVKTTGLGKFFPFYVSRNEVRCSEACPRQFNLYPSCRPPSRPESAPQAWPIGPFEFWDHTAPEATFWRLTSVARGSPWGPRRGGRWACGRGRPGARGANTRSGRRSRTCARRTTSRSSGRIP